jgi:lantibiotic biosynthesis dehydratase-like protein
MRESASRESDWVSAHAFYYEDLDRLVVDVIAPLTEDMTEDGLAHRWFFLRYWDGGPHVRLRVLPAREEDRAEVEELIGDRFGTYFARNPAAGSVGQDEYARIARLLAHWEGVPSHSERLYPNNSVSFIPYRREHDRYGRGASMDAVEQHFVESSRIAMRTLTKGTSPDQRTSAAAAVILLTWFSCESDPASLTSRMTARGRDLADVAEVDRATFPTVTERTGDGLVDLARRMWALAARATAVSATGTLVDWARSMAALRDALTEQVTGDALAAPVRGWQGPGGIAAVDPNRQVLVVLDTCAHLMCNRLGIAPVTEGTIRRLAAEAVGALSG